MFIFFLIVIYVYIHSVKKNIGLFSLCYHVRLFLEIFIKWQNIIKHIYIYITLIHSLIYKLF